MTPLQFDDWFNDVCRKFPAIGEWVRKLGNAGGGLLADWSDALESTDLADALDANKRLLAGDDDGPGKFPSDWQMLPAKVKSLAWRLRQENTPKISSREQLPDRDYRNPPGDLGIGRMFRRLIELKEQGMAPAEAKAQALLECPIGYSPFREPRFGCLECQDTGRVLVASPAAIKAVLLGEFPKCHHREAAARCFCHTGTKLQRNGDWQTFDPAWDFRVKDSLWGEAVTAEFTEWVERQREQFETDRLKQFEWKAPAMPNYAAVSGDDFP